MFFVLQDQRRAWICRASQKQAFERTQRARASAGKAVAEPSALNEGSCWSLKYCDRLQTRCCSPDGFGDVVHILGLNGGVQVVLQDAREVVLQFAAPEVPQNLLPVWWRLLANTPSDVSIPSPILSSACNARLCLACDTIPLAEGLGLAAQKLASQH